MALLDTELLSVLTFAVHDMTSVKILSQKLISLVFIAVNCKQSKQLCVFREMEKIEYRSVIKFLHKKGKTNEPIKDDLDEVYRKAASLATVKFWKAEFVRGRTSVFDDERSGRRNEVTTPEMFNEVHDMIMADHQIQLREFVETLNISYERVHIIHHHLDMKKLSARWVPHLLTIDQMRKRVTTSEMLLAMIRRDPKDFLHPFMTADETWVHYYIPETKEQSKQWRKCGERPPNKVKSTHSAGKVMATVFWDAKGSFTSTAWKKKKQSMASTTQYSCKKYITELCRKRPDLTRKKELFHQDNTPAYRSAVAMAKLHELGYELVEHLQLVFSIKD